MPPPSARKLREVHRELIGNSTTHDGVSIELNKRAHAVATRQLWNAKRVTGSLVASSRPKLRVHKIAAWPGPV